jgi:hypothetical protein
VTLSLTSAPLTNNLRAVFTFYKTAEGGPVPTGVFDMVGVYNPLTRRLTLAKRAWVAQPSGYQMVDVSGALSADGTTISGTVAGPGCTTISARRQ